jgi:hemerythrin superfamily protein
MFERLKAAMSHMSGDLKSPAKDVMNRMRGDPATPSEYAKAGQKVAPDVTRLLEEDHRLVMGWFDAYRFETDPGYKEAWAVRICTALIAHMQAEEEILYPAAKKALADKGMVDEAEREHDEARELIDRIVEAGAASSEEEDLILSLSAAIQAHVAEEESEFFPKVRACDLDLYDLGARLAARRTEILQELTATGPLPARTLH